MATDGRGLNVVVEPFLGPAAEWDAFVATVPGHTHFHRLGWLEVMSQGLGHQTFALAAREGGQLVGVLPLVRVRSLVFGHYLMSMPFVNYGGPLGTVPAVRGLVAEAVRMARADRVKLLELRSRVPLDTELPVSHRKITVVLDLPGTEDLLWKQLPAKLRSQVRRPEKEGVSFAFGPDLVDDFYRVFAHHMRDLGTPVMPRRFFELLPPTFGDSVWFGVARLGDRPIACGAGFRWGDEFEITWASSLREFGKMAPNMGLYGAFMRRAVAEGVRCFNFGRCTPGSGTHRFKQQWGSRDEALWWYQNTGQTVGTSAPPNQDHGVFAMAAKVWSKLPLGLANALGPRIVRFIP